MIDVTACHSPGSVPKGVDMKLFLRGLLALGVSAAVALTSTAAEGAAPRLLPSKSTPAITATPAASPVVATAGGCTSCVEGSAHRVLKGRFGRRGDGAVGYAGATGFGSASDLSARTAGLGAKADRVAEAY